MNVNPDAIALGIDLGGTKILSAVINSRGEILAQDYGITPAEKDHESVIDATAESVGRTLDRAHISISELITVGLAVSGLSNPETGILFTSPHLPGMRDVPILEIIEKRLGKKTFLINDANAAALGEMRFGAARGFRNIVYITLSTGIGGGIGIPHGKIKDLETLVLGFGLSRKGIDFESIDGQLTHIFFVLITPEDSTGLHLKLLARISRILKNDHFKDRLLNAADRQEIFEVIKEEDEEF